MKKNKSKDYPVNSSGLVGYSYGYVTHDNITDRLTGRILNIIEAVGLPEKQEESIKSLIREEIWKCFEDAIYISPERHTEIRELYYKKKKEIGNDVPMSAI